MTTNMNKNTANLTNCFKTILEENIPVISHTMIKRGIEQGLIQFKPNTPDGYEVVCWIGDHWFYFAGMEGEDMLAEDYLKEVPMFEIESEVYEVLKGFMTIPEFLDEYKYYAYYLQENLKPLNPGSVISTKKFKKYLMSKGLDRNTANDVTFQMNKMRKWYYTTYVRSYESADIILKRIELQPSSPAWIQVNF